MSRNLASKPVDKYSPLSAYTKQRTSSPTKKLGTNTSLKPSGKSSKQPSAPSNSKENVSHNIKNKKDTTDESSQEKPESTQSSYDGQYKRQTYKSVNPREGSRLLDLCESDKTKVGELIKRIAGEKEAKESLQQELQKRQNEYEKTIEGLKKNNQEILKNTSEAKEDIKNSIGIMKSVEAINSKQRQNTLFSNLISNKEQRAYNYKDNPLIADKENIFRHNENTSKSLTPMARHNNTPNNRNVPVNSNNRFDELELELEIADKRDRLGQPRKESENLENIPPHSYKMMKFQKLQEEKKPVYTDKLAERTESVETPQTVFSPVKTFFYSSKFSQPTELQEQPRPPGDPVKTFSTSHSNYLSASPNQSKKKTDLYSPNKSEQYSIAVTKESGPGKDNGQNQEWNNYVDEKAKYKTFSSSSSNIAKGIPPKAPSDSGSLLRDSGIRIDNNSPSQGQNRSTGRKSSERYSAEPSDRVKKDQDEGKGVSGVVDLGEMNVNQLIELKKIIDERIEIAELRNKSTRVKKSPQRVLQKADKIVKSPENQRFSQKINIGQDVFNLRKLSRDSSTDKFRKTDGFLNTTEQEKEALGLKQSASLGLPNQRNYLMNGKYGASAGNFYPAAESEGLRGNFSDSSLAKGSHVHVSNEKEIEDLYNQKLREFLEVRDTMIKIRETSSSSSHSNFEEAYNVPVKEKRNVLEVPDNSNLLSSNILFQFGSPLGITSPLSMAPPLNEKDLFASPPVPKQTKDSANFGKNAATAYPTQHHIEAYGYGVDKLTAQKNFSFARSGGSSEKNSGLLNFGKREDFTGTDLMKLVSNIEKNRAMRSENRPVLETTNKLTKKELDRLINKANQLEDSQNESADENQKGNILDQLSRKNKELLLSGGKHDQPFVLPDDSLSILETPTLNPLHLNSRSNSSIIETDLSIIAINNKIDEMFENLGDNKY